MTGTATISFGATPVSEGSVTVTGQTGILSGSFVEAFLMVEAATGNTVTDARFAGVSLRIIVGDIVAATGFTIYATATSGLITGDLNIRWVWI
jgi:hypothetical protein